ncbi:hypothetical protein ACFQVA_32685 [Actinomadura keratinilytica]
MNPDKVTATQTIPAPAPALFTLLANPATHAAIDGTGWVQEPVDRARLTQVGQVFRMGMYHPDHPLGVYQVANQVHVLDPPRAIGWRTGRRRRVGIWSSAAGPGVTTCCRWARRRPRSG